VAPDPGHVRADRVVEVDSRLIAARPFIRALQLQQPQVFRMAPMRGRQTGVVVAAGRLLAGELGGQRLFFALQLQHVLGVPLILARACLLARRATGSAGEDVLRSGDGGEEQPGGGEHPGTSKHTMPSTHIF
jgi:hypothetical protein